MEPLGELIGNFIIKNDNELDLFKVFFYENGISFDSKFLKGVVENKKTYKRFEQINDIWSSKKFEKEFIIDKVMSMLQENQEYLSKFFYDEEEIVEEFPINNFDKKDKYKEYFEKIKETRDIKSITRKEFESKIVDDKIGNYYVENFKLAKKADFFTYKSKQDSDCFIMVIDERIKIGFAEQ